MSIVALPIALVRAIAEEGDRLPSPDLVYAAQRLSAAYRRESRSLPARLNDAERAAYVVARLPATYAAVCVALAELARAIDTAGMTRCLDVGAGPGTASLAISGAIPHVNVFSQLERDAGWKDIAGRLADALGFRISHTTRDNAMSVSGSHHLVVAAYMLNEVPQADLDTVVRSLWSAASSALIVVEPGTPAGFAVVRRVRELCLEEGGHAAAPCTHNAVCPMTSRDWCHRTARIERGALHRRLKLAQLGFEDEKFSYVVMTRPKPRRIASSRIVRRPIRAGGHTHLDLCSEDGLSRSTIGRAQGDTYKAARNAEWGGLWPPTAPGRRETE